AACDRADRRAGVDEREERCALQRILAARALEVRRQPEQEEPPDRIGDELADQEGPNLTIPEELRPRQTQDFLRRRLPCLDVLQLIARQSRVILRCEERSLPEDQPHESDRADRNERG